MSNHHWYNTIGLFLEDNLMTKIKPGPLYDIIGLNINNIRCSDILRVEGIMKQLGWMPVYGAPKYGAPSEFVYHKVFDKAFSLL